MLDELVLDRLGGLAPAAARALAVELPDGRRVGPGDAAVLLRARSWRALAPLLRGRIGRIARDYVEGRVELEGPMHRIIELAGELVPDTAPTAASRAGPLDWLRSAWRHRPQRDAWQVRRHYDVSDAFYALWLDPRRVYSCAYWAQPGLTLAQAQEAKLELVCRKLLLRPGLRLLDIGAGWGALLLWAAEHHGVQATGITLSRHQQAHVERLIDERGLRGRVQMRLLDWRDLPEDEPWDRIASVGMFEHVGRARLPAYFAKIRRLLAPGGLLLNHGITAGGTRNAQLGAGIGDFVERHIFPGGELLHVSHVLRVMAEQGLETVDMENLRPHYARTLWSWSDALEARLEAARRVADERTLRAFRLYLAGSAMGFERGWMALHQLLATRPSGRLGEGALRGAQSAYPFNRQYVYSAG
ncbi:class I SAM-dependent methyltransferase [Rubrivivax gelatinosus]|uniref:Cyclopropane-fatty-acyl-phospholipid synthase n=1 Tax=Rubrivivax gelatinosus (strain NBRC 100245 / IL144) TaxID=983917 RepID=I0HXN3_RUBGI|nr:class I SAM-dependent methyltransferase [Rubrivivax gelatinosus]MBG6079702.1 cyclopropane-fatty-acyl-phospholipid synthase [Rubrivivax gelatinosus]BAL97770.1 cyclopropane-fatty-acyl-phospholipid synthase [Rubrivivax gelatinosus IL144]